MTNKVKNEALDMAPAVEIDPTSPAIPMAKSPEQEAVDARPEGDPGLAASQQHRAEIAAARAGAAPAEVERRIGPPRRSGLAAAVGLEEFRTRYGPTWRARTVELGAPEHDDLMADGPVLRKLAGLRQRLLWAAGHFELHCRNADVVRGEIARLERLTPEDLFAFDQYRTGPTATARRAFTDAEESLRSQVTAEAWTSFEEEWNKYCALFTSLPPRARLRGQELAETRPAEQPRRAISSLSGGEE